MKKTKDPNQMKGYWSLEQRVARKADNWIKLGKFTEKGQAISAAMNDIEQKRLKNQRNRTLRGKRDQTPKPPGYQSRTSWTFRRMASFLQADNNTIDTLGKAKEIAEKEYKEKLVRNAERKREYDRQKKLKKLD